MDDIFKAIDNDEELIADMQTTCATNSTDHVRSLRQNCDQFEEVNFQTKNAKHQLVNFIVLLMCYYLCSLQKKTKKHGKLCVCTNIDELECVVKFRLIALFSRNGIIINKIFN